MKEVFQLKGEALYSSRFPFSTYNVRTESYGKNSLSYLGPNIWSLIPDNIKSASSLTEFKRLMKACWHGNLKTVHVNYAKTYVAVVGFVEVS